MRILIVEDEPLVAQRLERLVREVLGADLAGLHAATTLDAAIARLAAPGTGPADKQLAQRLGDYRARLIAPLAVR